MSGIGWVPERVDIVVLQDPGGVEIVDKVASILLLERVNGRKNSGLVAVEILEICVSCGVKVSVWPRTTRHTTFQSG